MVSEIISALILAIVQGITEWFPVSSSGHLVLFEKLLDFNSGGLVFDVAVHFGTLMAVFVYFGKDVVGMLEDFLKGDWKSDKGKLFWLIVLATIPAGLVGYFWFDTFKIVFGSLGITALGFGITGLLLLIGSLKKGKVLELSDISWKIALLIGGMQVLSLLPGVSRSGVTIVAALLLGLKEKDAVKFSFLMAIPVIFGANVLALGSQALPPNMIWAALVSFVVGLGIIHLLYSSWLMDRKNLRWFGAYALILGLVLGLIVVL